MTCEIPLTLIRQHVRWPRSGELMRTVYMKSSQIALALFIGCIAICGIRFSTPGYCNEAVDRCFQASESAQSDTAFGFQYRKSFSGQPLQTSLSNVFSDRFNPAESCCKTAEGGNRTQIAFFKPYSSRYLEKANKRIEIVGIDTGLRKEPTQTHITIPRPKAPLYIQIESILC